MKIEDDRPPEIVPLAKYPLIFPIQNLVTPGIENSSSLKKNLYEQLARARKTVGDVAHPT